MRLSASDPRVYRVWNASVPRVLDAVTRDQKFWAAQNFFADRTACEFDTASNRFLIAGVSRPITSYQRPIAS